METRTQVSALKMHSDELKGFVTRSKMLVLFNEVAKRNGEVRGSTRGFCFVLPIVFVTWAMEFKKDQAWGLK